MAIKQAIRDLILGDSSLLALLGNRVSPRISKTGDTLPRLAYLRTSLEQGIYLVGTSTKRDDDFNIIIDSNSSDEADLIASDLRALFQSVASTVSNGVTIRRIYVNPQTESHYYPEGREKPIYQILIPIGVSFFG